MMSKYFLILFIPAIYGHIAIQIKAGRTETETSVEFSGQNIEIISDKDRQTFNIEGHRLKKICAAFSGREPTDVFVKSPTPWEDVYRKFGWPQIQRTLSPVRSRVTGIHTKPVILSTREFVNYNQVKEKYNAAISHQIEETVTTSWSISKELTVGEEITYSVNYVNYAAGSIEGSTSMSFSANWGNYTSKSKAVTLGTTTSVDIELPPGQAVVSTLSATHGTLEIEVDYEAYLTGNVFANYDRKFNDHYWWSYPIKWVMVAGGIQNNVTSTEKISIGFYTSAKIEVSDKRTSSNVKTTPAMIISEGNFV